MDGGVRHLSLLIWRLYLKEEYPDQFDYMIIRPSGFNEVELKQKVRKLT